MTESPEKTILLVDDEAVLVLSLKSILEQYGFRTLYALSGEDALDTFGHEAGIDLVLMDIDLGQDMDGIEAARRIMDLRDVPVLFLSGYMNQEISDKINTIDSCGYVVKNSGDDVLITSIRQALRLHEVRQDLARERTRYLTLLESIPDSVYVLDLEWRHTMVNEAATLFTGMPRQKLLGNKLTDLLPAIEETPYFKAFRRVMDSGIPETVSAEFVFPDGRKGWYDVGITPVPEGILCISRDITRLKQSEQEKDEIQKQLAQAQKMEAIGTLAGGLAHDFNNVLGAMRGSLEIVETYLEKEKLQNGEKIRKYLDTAMKSTVRATDIIKQLLVLSRREERNPVPLNLVPSLEHVQKIAQNSFPKSVILDFAAAENSLYIHADQTQIEQALLNICVNASHAMTLMRAEGDEEGGVLTVRAERIRTGEEFYNSHNGSDRNSGYVKITVSDTGVGMDADVVKQIFEPFFTTKDHGAGTGLGLSMTYSIITAHHGFIDVESRKGSGTVFTVYLPELVITGKETREKKTAAPRPVKGEGVILVIDDEPSILEVAREFLTQLGYTVLIAEGGPAGIAMFREKRHEINGVLLDLSMPRMSGFDVFKKLREMDSGVRVLLASGFANDSRVRKILDAGARGFISKPFNLLDLSRKIGEILA